MSKKIIKIVNNDLKDKLEVEGVNSNGYGIMPKTVMQDSRLTIEAKAIYAYIVSYAGAGNSAFPSLRKILTDLQISENRFYKHRKLLIDCNYITVTAVRNEKKVIVKNIYKLIANPKIEKGGGTLQNEGYPIPQNEGYPIPQNEGHKINNVKINNIKINNEKEDSQSSLSFSKNDDDKLNIKTNGNSSFDDSQKKQPRNLDPKILLAAYLKGKEHLKPLAMSLLVAGVKEKDCLEIIEFLALLPRVDQQVSDIVNAQIRANEKEATTNGLSDYKAYFLRGLKMKLENSSILVSETDITDPETVTPIPKVTLHNWVD
jgi:hypothetical protein